MSQLLLSLCEAHNRDEIEGRLRASVKARQLGDAHRQALPEMGLQPMSGKVTLSDRVKPRNEPRELESIGKTVAKLSKVERKRPVVEAEGARDARAPAQP